MAGIAVLGGGVAGLSAAYALAPFHKVTVLEEMPSLGGIGETLSCKAGTECSVCTACTLPDLVEAVRDEENVTIRTGTSITGTSHREGEGWALTLQGGERMEADAVIVATGLDVSDGSELPELGAGRLEGVVTALELDQRMRRVGMGEEARPDDMTSVAIIQCVGSRDTGQLPYCSRVCCAYTARLALELRERNPETRVTVFYMDLQREDGVAARQMDAAVADPGIEYVRSRPAQVQGVPGGGLEVTFEDTLEGDIHAAEFDMVVLSTGVVPSQGTRQVIDLLGLDTDPRGFVALAGDGPTATSTPSVFAAGGATGPVDMVEAAVGGMAAAAAVLAERPPEWPGYPPRLIVVGGGPAAEVADRSAKLAGADTSTILGVPGKGLRRLEGEPLAFLARMGVPGGETTIDLKGDAVVIAPERGGTGDSQLVGAAPLDDVRRRLAKDRFPPGHRFALVMGDDAEALHLARAIKERLPEARVDVLYREMAVAGEGMQELQLDLVDQGVRFHRYSSLTLAEEGPSTLAFTDQLAPELGEVVLEVDQVSAPGRMEGTDLVWPWFLSRYAPDGVPSGARLNVLPVATPRMGVYTTTPATRTGVATALGGAAAAAMALSDYARGFAYPEEVAEVDPDLCAACLNCLRVCPHDAIVFNEGDRAAVVMPRACQACGVCLSICPAQAITFIPSDQLEEG